MTKNKTLYTLAGALLVAGTLLFSCTREKALEPEQAGQMRFAVTVEGTTKASMTSADLGQFYLKVTGPNNAFSYFESITKDAQGNWTASRPILWKDEASAITYAAASYGALGADYFNILVTNDLFTSGATMGLLTDQSTQAKLNAADLLTMASTDLTFAASNKGIVPITLKHGLAKVNFQLTLAAEYKDNGIGLEENPISGVILHGVRTSFNFKPLTGGVIPQGAPIGAVVPFASTYDNTAALATFEAILVPEEFAAGALTLYFSVNGKDFQWTNSEALELVQGGEYTIPVSVAYVAAPVTPDPGDTVLDGAINGKFSVSATKQVYFSKGNLRYASSKWSFFDNQYDYYSSYSADAWDHFGWSTSATTYGMNTSEDYNDYSGNFVDWGATMGAGWFTLSKDEWTYLLNTRSASTVNGTANGRYAKAEVKEVMGVILFPDTYTHPDGVTAPVGVNATNNTGWNGNSYTVADWTKMESAGCVFLPATGSRNGSTMDMTGWYGYYWSATSSGTVQAYYVSFIPNSLNVYSYNRCTGYSVRLVREVAAADPATDPAGPTAYTLAESTVGMIVGSDGKAYAVADKDNLPSGVTAVAMVACKSGSNGLAIQLNDSPVKMKWADAKTYVDELDAVSGGTWRLPSKADWQNMFVGCAVSGDASASDDMNPIAGFKAKIAATGITWQTRNYWSSTGSDSSAWLVGVNLGDSSASASFIQGPPTLQMYVRACLAF